MISFNFFGHAKKATVSREDLIEFLIKEIMLELKEDRLVSIHSVDSRVPGQLSAMTYDVASNLCYGSNDSYWGWITVWDEYEMDHGENGFMVYLLNITSNGEVKVPFEFRIKKDPERFSFVSNSIPDIDNGLDKCVYAIKRFANFNDYSNPPSYVIFASMIGA